MKNLVRRRANHRHSERATVGGDVNFLPRHLLAASDVGGLPSFRNAQLLRESSVVSDIEIIGINQTHANGSHLQLASAADFPPYI